MTRDSTGQLRNHNPLCNKTAIDLTSSPLPRNTSVATTFPGKRDIHSMFPAARVRPPSVSAAMQVADEQVNMCASTHLGKVTGATECVLARICSPQSGGRAGTHQVNMRAITHPGNVTGATECVLARICPTQSGEHAGTHQAKEDVTHLEQIESQGTEERSGWQPRPFPKRKV